MVEGHFADELRTDRRIGTVGGALPATGATGCPPVTEAISTDDRLQLFQDRPPLSSVERRRVAYVVERTVAVVEPEQQGSDSLAVLRNPVSADDAVDGAEVLDLGPASFAGLVDAGRILCNDAVETGAFVACEPSGRFIRVRRLRSDADDRAALECTQQANPPFLEWPVAQVVRALCQEVEEDNGSGCLLRQHPDARCGRVDSLLECVEVEAVVGGDDHFAVDDGSLGERFLEWLDQLREIALERQSGR